MKRKIAMIMTAVFTVTSLEPTTALNISAQEITETDSWMSEVPTEESSAEENIEEALFTDGDADENNFFESEGFTSEMENVTDEETWVESADGGKVLPDKNSITHMMVEKSYDVEIDEGKSVWFLFEPEESGKYNFESNGEYDTFGVLYDAEGKQLVVADDGQDGTDFDIYYDLEEGSEYYLETGLVDVQNGTYKVSVNRVDESTDDSETPIDNSKIQDIEIMYKEKYCAGLESFSSNDIQLNITYSDGSTELLSEWWDEDQYCNTFRLMLVGPNQEEYDLKDNGNVLFETAGNYKLFLYINEGETPFVEKNIIVEDVPEEIPEIEIGREFTVSDGMEWFRFTPEKKGYYCMIEAPSDAKGEIINAECMKRLESICLEKGEEYIFRYSGEAGIVVINEAPKPEAFSLKREPYFLAFQEQKVYKYEVENKIILVGHYSNGEDCELDDNFCDRWGNSARYEIIYANGETIPHEYLEAGDYNIALELYQGEREVFKTQIPFHIYSIKDVTEQSLITGRRKSLNTDEDFDNGYSYGFFSYKPEEDGTYCFETYNMTNGMFGVKEDGDTVQVNHSSLYWDEETHLPSDRADYYYATLSKGSTYYFAVSSESDYITLKAEKSTAVVQSATLFNKKTYYDNIADMSSIHKEDFYLDLTYSDGTSEKLKCGRIGKNGDYFHVEVEQAGSFTVLTGGSIELKQGEYLAKAYLNDAEESIAQTSIQMRSVARNQMKNIKEGEIFHVNGEDVPEIFCFTPSVSGEFYIDGVPESADIEFYRYDAGSYYTTRFEPNIEEGEKCLVKYTGSVPADLIIGVHTEQTSDSFELELNKKYENLSIGNSGDGEVYFTYVPSRTAVYQLELVTANPYGLDLWIYSDDDGSMEFHRERQPQFILKEGQEYTFQIRCGGEFNRGVYIFSVMLTEIFDRSLAPISATINNSNVTSAIGIDSLEEPLSYMYVDFEYDKTVGSYVGRNSFSLGTNTDYYGNEYEVSLEDIPGNQNGKKEYKLKLISGDLIAEKKIAVFDSTKMTELVEEQKLQVNYGQKDTYTEDLWCYRFIPTEDKCYTLNFDSAENMESILLYVYRKDGKRVPMTEKRSYALKAGETYYLKVVCSSWGEGRTNIFLGDTREVVDIEIIQEPYEVYGDYKILKPVYDGARFKITYSDGTQTEVNYGEVCGIINYSDEYEKILAREYWSGDKKTVTVQFTIGAVGPNSISNGHKTEKKTYKALGLEDIASLPVGEKQNMELGNGRHRRLFKVQVKEDGSYFIRTDISDNWSYFLSENGERLNAEEKGTLLKKGQIYYAVIGGSGNGSILLIDTTCTHTYKWIIDKEATCGESGSKHEECIKCGLEQASVEIPATGKHEYQEIIDKEATCGKAGTKHGKCVKCGLEQASVEIPATGKHEYQEIIDKEATCGKAGTKHRKCVKCGMEQASVEIPATGKHEYQEIIDKEATCVEPGSKHEECVVCHAKKAAVRISATGKHAFTNYKVVRVPSINVTGVEERKCTVCGKIEQKFIAKLEATISVKQKKITLAKGQSVAAPEVFFANGDRIVSWKSSKNSVAKVSKNGKITGKKAGKATITVSLASKKTAKITVTVKNKIPVSGLKADVKLLTLKKGKSYQLKVERKPLNTTDKLSFKSSNTKIATVSSNGKIKAKKKGKVTITITAGKKKVSCKVIVK